LTAALENNAIDTLDESELTPVDKIGETFEATFNELSKAAEETDTVVRRNAVWGIVVRPKAVDFKYWEETEIVRIDRISVTLTAENANDDVGSEEKLAIDRAEDSVETVPTTEDPALGSSEIKGAEVLDEIENIGADRAGDTASVEDERDSIRDEATEAPAGIESVDETVGNDE